MDTISKLTELLSHLPGIGPRQARRIVYFLLSRTKQELHELANTIESLGKGVLVCTSCYRFFAPSGEKHVVCSTCSNPHRNNERLMVVEKDVDFENIEKSGIYDGKYFVLGGTVSLLEKKPDTHIRKKELVSIVRERAQSGLREIILALSATPQGEETGNYLEEEFKKDPSLTAVTITRLGRGLSTGSELEYSDPETIRTAFERRV